MKKRVFKYSSILAIFLCMTMIVGATFALFTSKSEVNIAVSSGEVNVTATIFEEKPETYSLGVEQTPGTFANGGTALFDSETKEMSLSLMTPGDMAKFTIQMTNESTVNVQYRILWTVTGTLADALTATATIDGESKDFTANGATDWQMWEATSAERTKDIPVSVLLPREIEDAYQGKDAKINFVVEAVQGNAIVKDIRSEDQLQTFVEMGGGTADLVADITLTEPLTIPEGTTVTLNLNGKTITNEEAIVNNGTLTINGQSASTFSMRPVAVASGTLKGAIVTDGSLTIKNVTIECNIHKSDGHVIKNNGILNLIDSTVSSLAKNGGSALNNTGTATVTNTTLNGASNAVEGWPSYTVNNTGVMVLNDSKITSVHGAVASYGEGAVVTLNDTDIDMSGIPGFTSHGIYTYDDGKAVVNGGTISNNATDQGATGASVINGCVTVNGGKFTGRIEAYDGTPVIYGGTFTDDPTNYLAPDYYQAVKDETTDVYTITYKDGISAPENNAALDEALKAGDTTVLLGSGNYIIPDSAQGKTLTIVGNGKTVIATQDDGSYEGCDYSLDGATVVFENITINTNSATYTGYARLKATYKNCTINGTYTLYDDSVFENCTFNVSGDVYNIWTWGAPNATFNNCTFNSDGKALLLYGGTETVLTVNDCTFNDKGGLTDKKAAIEIGNDYNKHKTLIVNNTTVNGYEVNDKGICTNSTLWANKNSMLGSMLSVTIDGQRMVWDVAGLSEATANGENVLMMNDIYMEAATTAPYGNKYGIKMDGGVLDGNGFELYIECYGDDYGIMTSGGTIKNLTIKEGCRAIMIMYPTQDVILDNVTIGGNGVLYPVNTGEAGADGVNLIVKNSTLKGWTSFSNIASATFENCKFEQGTYYNNIYGRVFKPYVNTTIKNCEFVKAMNLDLSGLGADQTVILEGCKVDGQALNSSVVTIPETDEEYDTEIFTVDLPTTGGRTLSDCVTFK